MFLSSLNNTYAPLSSQTSLAGNTQPNVAQAFSGSLLSNAPQNYAQGNLQTPAFRGGFFVGSGYQPSGFFVLGNTAANNGAQTQALWQQAPTEQPVQNADTTEVDATDDTQQPVDTETPGETSPTDDADTSQTVETETDPTQANTTETDPADDITPTDETQADPTQTDPTQQAAVNETAEQDATVQANADAQNQAPVQQQESNIQDQRRGGGRHRRRCFREWNTHCGQNWQPRMAHFGGFGHHGGRNRGC